MSVSNKDLIMRYFEQHRAIVAVTMEKALEQMQEVNRLFMENVLELEGFSKKIPASSSIPPKDKEEMFEDDSSSSFVLVEKGGKEPTFALPEMISESFSVHRDSSSSSSGEEKEEASFLQDSSIEPETFPKEVMDAWDAEDLTGKKRKRKSASIWSPDNHKHEKVGKVINLMQKGNASLPKRELVDFLNFYKLVDKFGFEEAAAISQIYQSKFGRPLEGIINNLGHDGRNDEAKRIAHLIIQRATEEEDSGTMVERKRQGGTTTRICCLCGIKKQCFNTLWITEEGEDGLSPHPIARCCANLAHALIRFFEAIRDHKGLEECEVLFADIQDAHAGKNEKE